LVQDHTGLTAEKPDDVLMAAIAGGDHQAFQILMARHMKSVLALAQRMMGTVTDADEIAQEAFLRVWRTASRWRLDGGSRFTTWLYRVVVNLCLDRRRRAPFEPLDEGAENAVDTNTPGGLASFALREARSIVADALATLPDRQRAAIILYYFSEVSAPEAARILELSISALESLLVRGRRSMKRHLAGRGVRELGDVL
jgi:RNA polymerase sigma-70 factor (ECF subfamily)